MTELIPVIEIGYNNQGIPAPDQYPYWENPDAWNKYHEACYIAAGFKDKLVPYLSGASWYRLTDITKSNLTRLAMDHTKALRAGVYGREQSCAFSGGYVLRVDGQDKFFPQCCGELSDIKYWERLSNGQHAYYEGHPAPEIKFEAHNIVFDFSADISGEHFQPPPVVTILSVDRSAVAEAVEKAKTALRIFEERLNDINSSEHWNIEDIGGLLIWDNANYD